MPSLLETILGIPKHLDIASYQICIFWDCFLEGWPLQGSLNGSTSPQVNLHGMSYGMTLCQEGGTLAKPRYEQQLQGTGHICFARAATLVVRRCLAFAALHEYALLR